MSTPPIAGVDAGHHRRGRPGRLPGAMAGAAPTVRTLRLHSNAVAIWNAIDADAEVAPAERRAEAVNVVVWRMEQQPHFVAGQGRATLLDQISGRSIESAVQSALDAGTLSAPEQVSVWLRNWWQHGLLRRPDCPGANSPRCLCAGVGRTFTSGHRSTALQQKRDPLHTSGVSLPWCRAVTLPALSTT